MKPKIFGAFLVGGGLIALAYFYAPDNSPQVVVDPSNEVVTAVAPSRQAISVEDKNLNGIPDWKEPFEQVGDPLGLAEAASSTYSPPDTLTEQFSVDFYEKALRLKMEGDFNTDGPDVVANSVEGLARRAEDRIYFERDITIIPHSELDHETERTYFNEIATIMLVDAKTNENELIILQNALDSNNPILLEELAVNNRTYKSSRDRLLALPVPAKYVKQHLDLLNAVNAIFEDIIGMELVFEDPLYALLRVKRYTDDATGLFFALQNFFTVADSSGLHFESGDPVFIFNVFDPNQ